MLAEFLEVAISRPIPHHLAKFGPVLAKIDPTPGRGGPCLTMFGQEWSKLGRSRANVGPNRGQGHVRSIRRAARVYATFVWGSELVGLHSPLGRQALVPLGSTLAIWPRQVPIPGGDMDVLARMSLPLSPFCTPLLRHAMSLSTKDATHPNFGRHGAKAS